METRASPQYGSYLIWYDPGAALFRGRNLATGSDDIWNADPEAVVQKAIESLASPLGGEIWLYDYMTLPGAVIEINKDNVSLISLRNPGPRDETGPRPHIQKVLYSGPVRGGLLQGLHCREIQFDGSGNQQQMVLRDISMHPTGAADQQGLRFLGAAGYQQYIEIQNLKVALSGSGDSSAIEFGNSNNGSGHITFSGSTSIETEHDATGSPIAIKVSTGAETGTPIRFDNLSIVEGGGRDEGQPLRPIWMETQLAGSKGLRQMNIGRFFFEQHYTTPHTLVTIDANQGTGQSWFILTIDELAVTDESGKTVNLIDNRNAAWMEREQFLRVSHGYKVGTGTLALGNVNPHRYFRLYLGKISGLTPFGRLSTPFFESTPMSFVGPGGTSAAWTAGEYVVMTTPILVSSTDPWNLKDPDGNVVEAVPALQARSVRPGYRVEFPTGTPSIFA